MFPPCESLCVEFLGLCFLHVNRCVLSLGCTAELSEPDFKDEVFDTPLLNG